MGNLDQHITDLSIYERNQAKAEAFEIFFNRYESDLMHEYCDEHYNAIPKLSFEDYCFEKFRDYMDEELPIVGDDGSC